MPIPRTAKETKESPNRLSIICHRLKSILDNIDINNNALEFTINRYNCMISGPIPMASQEDMAQEEVDTPVLEYLTKLENKITYQRSMIDDLDELIS